MTQPKPDPADLSEVEHVYYPHEERTDHELRQRVDDVPDGTPEDVRERRRKLARDPSMRPRNAD